MSATTLVSVPSAPAIAVSTPVPVTIPKKTASNRLGRHLVSADQFTPEVLEELYELSIKMEDFFTDINISKRYGPINGPDGREEKNRRLNRAISMRGFLQTHGVGGRWMAPIFFEPSSRTYSSFHVAWKSLGGDFPFDMPNAGPFSSAVKHESLNSCITTFGRKGPNVIVMRHKENGAAETAARCAPTGCSIINAGDGTNEHPTQALLDFVTLRKLCGDLRGLRIAFGGDIKHSRTIRSLAILLSNKHWGVKQMYFCAPAAAQIDNQLRHILLRRGMNICCVGDKWPQLIQDRAIDVYYQTRVQFERIRNPVTRWWLNRLQQKYAITKPIAQAMQKNQQLLMHPLPINSRNPEIHPECEQYEIAIYNTQAQIGDWARMALLSHMFGPNGTALE